MREFSELAELGLLNRERRGNCQVYSAHSVSAIFSELPSILRKT